jgi:anti-anti-sigma factor
MKAHRMESAVRISREGSGATGGVVDRRRAASTEKTQGEAASSGRSSGPSSAGARRHTLILIGELDQRSARVLEAEVERLCEEGVAEITLDLRELTYIDSIGVAVLAVCCDLCKKRGHHFELIHGARFVLRAFERAGVSHLLPVEEGEFVVRRQFPLVIGQPRFAGGDR